MKSEILNLVTRLEELFLLIDTLTSTEKAQLVKEIDQLWAQIKKGIL